MRKTNEQTLKEVLKQMVDTYRLRSRLNQTKIEKVWVRTMGPAIGNYTREMKVRNHKLYVSIDSAPLRQELAMGRDKIRRILNEELGEDYLREVVIR